MKDQRNTPIPPGLDGMEGVKKPTSFERARRLFIAGIFVIVPAFVAVYAVLLIMSIADRIFGNLVEQIFRTFFLLLKDRGFEESPLVALVRSLASFVLACILIMFVGWISTFFFVRRAIAFGERIVMRLPLIKFFYSTPKEVLNTFAASKKQSFKRVVLVEYPRRGMWCLGFATGEVIKRPDETPMVCVFVPTTPNPTSGFLLLVPKQDVYDTNIPMEDGARLIISGGILAPAHIYTQRFAGLDQVPTLPPMEPLRVSEEIASIGERDEE